MSLFETLNSFPIEKRSEAPDNQSEIGFTTGLPDGRYQAKIEGVVFSERDDGTPLISWGLREIQSGKRWTLKRYINSHREAQWVWDDLVRCGLPLDSSSTWEDAANDLYGLNGTVVNLSLFTRTSAKTGKRYQNTRIWSVVSEGDSPPKTTQTNTDPDDLPF